MNRALLSLSVCTLALSAAAPALAGPEQFSKGPLITQSGGAVAKIDSDVPLAPGIDYRIDFDVGSGSAGKLNARIDSAARLSNMLAASGVPRAQINPALVVHGSAIYDVVNDGRYAAQYGPGAENPNAALVRDLIALGVPVYVCGQTAALLSVDKKDFLPGVKLTLSAMTSHAELLRNGYTLSP